MECKLCERPLSAKPLVDFDTENQTFECGSCGRFSATSEFLDDVKLPSRVRPALSAATRRASDRNRSKPLMLSTANWESLAEPFLHYSVQARARGILELLRTQSEAFGNEVEFSVETDWPRIAATSAGECQSLLEHLEEEGLVRGSGTVGGGLVLTMKGWEAVEPIAGGTAGLCFVAMAFASEYDRVFDEGIEPAVRDCGIQAIRLDRTHFKEPVSDRVLADIRRCQFIVSDFTDHRPSVYFEARFAMGLGRDIIWTCHEDHVKNLGFDTRQYPHIEWKEPADLREKLRTHIRAVIPGAKQQ